MTQKIKKVKQYILEKDETYKIWSDMGVFEEMSSDESLALSKKLKELMVVLINSPGILIMKNGDTMIFPIVIRAYRKHFYLIENCLRVIFHVNGRQGLLFELVAPGVDAEAEFCAQMAKEISDLKL